MFQSCSCDVRSALCTPSCRNTCCVTFPLETLPLRDPIEGVVYLQIVLSPEEASRICEISVFGKRLSRKSDNVVVFHFLSTSWYNSRSNHSGHAYCCMIMDHLEHHLLCVSSHYWWCCFRHQFWLSLFVWHLPFDLSSKGGPASSYTTTGIALRVTGVLKPPHHDKVETPTRKTFQISHYLPVN